MIENIFKKAIRIYGEDYQILMLIEEMGELLSAISKYKRKRIDKSHIIEEIVDVMLMLKQLRYIYGISDLELSGIYLEKVMRLKEKLNGKEIKTNAEKGSP